MHSIGAGQSKAQDKITGMFAQAQAAMQKAFWLSPNKQISVLAAMLAEGHILIEDSPGLGKTTLAKILAKLMGLNFSRIQFTSDLLPGDVTGQMIYNPKESEFVFRPGPIFSNLVLADELNRGSGRTQSALLEAMAEGSVTVDRQTHALPRPFIVIATENHANSVGTFELPESQLDRFSLKIDLGYPPQLKEVQLLQDAGANQNQVEVLETMEPAMRGTDWNEVRQMLRSIHVSAKVANYASEILQASRRERRLRLGLSTRAGISWMMTAKGIAMLRGRGFVIPDDLIDCAEYCLPHRVSGQAHQHKDIITDILRETAIP